MNKSDQARALYSEGNLSISQIAKQLDMHYSHARSAVKRLLEQDTGHTVQIITPKRKVVWINALNNRSVDKVRLYLACKSKDADWHSVIMDKDALSIAFAGKDLYMEFFEYRVKSTSASCVSPFNMAQIKSQMLKLIPNEIHITESPNSIQIKLNLHEKHIEA